MTLVNTPVASPIVDILDVGHGSCIVVRIGAEVLLIDAGPGGPVLEYLRMEGIKHINTILVSHADADHIGGISAILGQPDLRVDNIVWNGDSMKQSTLWVDLVYQLADLQAQGRTTAQQNAHAGLFLKLGAEEEIEVRLLAPGLVLRQLGAGSSLRDGRAISSNTVSVVAQVLVGGEALILVPGDLDQIGYDELSSSEFGSQMKAKYLVLPHHGGLMGTLNQTKKTIAAFVTAVNPEVVFVSNGRGKFNNPRQEVVDAVREAGANLPLSCTQLAANCAVKEISQTAVDGPYSAGWARGQSCQGSTRLTIGDGIGAPLNRLRHIAFLRSQVPKSICSPGDLTVGILQTSSL